MKQLQLRRIFAIFIFLMCTVPGNAYCFLLQRDTIPFELTAYNNIIVKAVFNHVDTAKLMFHTASNEFTLTEAATKKIKTVLFEEKVAGVTSWGGETNDSRLSLHNTIAIGNLRWIDFSVWDNVNTGQEGDGKFGLGLLSEKVVEIDFDREQLVVSQQLPDDVAAYQKLSLMNENNNLFVNVRFSVGNKEFENKFLIHSGYAGALMLDDAFVVENGLDSLLPSVGEKVLHDAFGNAIVSKKVVVPCVKLGKEEIQNVPAGYFKSVEGLQRISILGGDVLKRFNMVIDAERNFLYLKPNQLYNTVFTAL